MATSTVFGALNALISIISTALPTVTVLDGPQPEIPSDLDFVIVGCDDPVSPSMISAVESGAQDWAALGAGARDETFAIYSTYVSWGGATDLSLGRARAQTNLALVETALRTSSGITLNGALTTNKLAGWCGFEITRLSQIQAASGAGLQVQFVVLCRTRV